MVLLLLSAAWILALSLTASLCVVACEGDGQHDRPTPRSEVGEPMNENGVVSITRAQHERHTAPEHTPATLAETAT